MRACGPGRPWRWTHESVQSLFAFPFEQQLLAVRKQLEILVDDLKVPSKPLVDAVKAEHLGRLEDTTAHRGVDPRRREGSRGPSRRLARPSVLVGGGLRTIASTTTHSNARYAGVPSSPRRSPSNSREHAAIAVRNLMRDMRAVTSGARRSARSSARPPSPRGSSVPSPRRSGSDAVMNGESDQAHANGGQRPVAAARFDALVGVASSTTAPAERQLAARM